MNFQERLLLNINENQKVISDLNNELDISDSNLKVYKILPRTGKQGFLGILEQDSEEEKKKFIFKVSQYFNFTIRGENICMQALNKISDFCINFCRGYGIKKVLVESNYRNEKNPFEIKSKYPIYQDVLFMENLEGCRKFYRFIKSKSVDQEIIFSIIKQTLCSVSVAQKNCNFTHYDLHSNNVLIGECDPKTLMFYRIDEQNAFLIPSYGYYPIIIDFGFSYCDEMKHHSLFQTLAHTDVGFMSDKFDNMSDPRLFLTTVSYELKKYRKDNISSRFKLLVRNIFSSIKQDWESGWDDVDDMSASDYALSFLKDRMKLSKFFHEYGFYCIDLLEGLIQLPLKKRKFIDINKTFDIFYSEFIKIENEIASNFYLLYIFKEMVSFAIDVKKEYMDGDSQYAVNLFKHKMNTLYSSISSFCNPKINYEKFLCSIYLIANQIEGILYQVTEDRHRERNRQKEKMDIKTIDEIINLVEYNFSDNYKLTNENKILVIDNILKKKYYLELNENQIQIINTYDESVRGYFLNNELLNN